MSSIYDWSPIAADNANADDGINWAEGQPPSSVNNSARAMMARLREFLADISGSLQATGTAELLNIAGNAAVKSYCSGIMLRFRVSMANAAKANLSLNALPPKPILKQGNAGAVALEGGEMQPNAVYECVYNTALGSGGAWFLLAPCRIPPPPPAPVQVPAGFVAPFCGEKAPQGWLKCNGDYMRCDQYKDLYAAIGGRFGSDGGGARFRLPDLRGEFIRGWADDRSDIDLQRGRSLGSGERCMTENHRHRGTTDTGGQHNHELPFYRGSADGGGGGRGFAGNGGLWTRDSGSHNHGFITDWGVNDNNRLGGETRPQNVALLYCIKY